MNGAGDGPELAAARGHRASNRAVNWVLEIWAFQIRVLEIWVLEIWVLQIWALEIELEHQLADGGVALVPG